MCACVCSRSCGSDGGGSLWSAHVLHACNHVRSLDSHRVSTLVHTETFVVIHLGQFFDIVLGDLPLHLTELSSTQPHTQTRTQTRSNPHPSSPLLAAALKLMGGGAPSSPLVTAFEAHHSRERGNVAQSQTPLKPTQRLYSWSTSAETPLPQRSTA